MKKTNFKSAYDFRKSLEARLQRNAKENGTDLQKLRRQVAFDRLLARFFSRPEPPFFLKGGYAMELRLEYARATKDIDITYLQRIQNREDNQIDLILEELRNLAEIDLGDYFTYTLGTSQLSLDNAPYSGGRYSISTFIDDKLFVRFHLDVGGDVLVLDTETVTTPDWLQFCHIPPPAIRMISIEQQFAEKIHAYTLPRTHNSRVKDLIDMILLMEMRTLQQQQLAHCLKQIFKIRKSHPLPKQLPPPPNEWTTPFSLLSEECGIQTDIMIAFTQVESLYQKILQII